MTADEDAIAKNGEIAPEVVSPFDVARLRGPRAFSGLDVSMLLERKSRNIAALMEANAIAYQDWQDMLRQQMLDATVSRGLAYADNKGAAAVRADRMREGLTEPFGHRREVAFRAARCKADIFGLMRERACGR